MFPIEFVRRAALYTPEAVAASDGETVWTYRQMMAEVDAMAAALQDTSGKVRPTVAVCGNNTLSHFATVMAVHACGGVLVPINARNSAEDAKAQIRRAAPDLIFSEKKTVALFEGLDVPVIGGVEGIGTTASAPALRAAFRGAAPRWPDVDLTDMNAIKFTGGTSGVPKGVVQSFRCVSTLIATMLLEFRFDAEDRHLCVAPISHGAGTFMIPILAAGGSNILVGDPKPSTVLDLLETGTGNTVFLPPTLIYAIIDAANGRRPGFDQLRHLIYGAAPMPPQKVREAREFFRGKLEAVYGQTEMPVVMSVLRAADLADDTYLTSAGRVSALSRVAVVDREGRQLPSGEVGEIVGQGDMMMNEYFQMPEETAMTIRGGWLHTGDLGYLDERGFLFIKDRLRDVIITGGFNVYPVEVEDALVRHEAVREAVAFAVPDEKWGERVEAAVELYAGNTATADDIIAFTKTVIGSVKAPKAVHIAEELPRSSIGKVVRKDARAWALARGEDA